MVGPDVNRGCSTAQRATGCFPKSVRSQAVPAQGTSTVRRQMLRNAGSQEGAPRRLQGGEQAPRAPVRATKAGIGAAAPAPIGEMQDTDSVRVRNRVQIL